MIAARQIFLGRGGGAKLPYDAEVEYLESTGTQWIDTGIIASATCDQIIDAAFMQNYTGYATALFGAGNPLSPPANRICTQYGEWTWWNGGSFKRSNVPIVAGEHHECAIGKNGFYLDGNLIASNAPSVPDGTSILYGYYNIRDKITDGLVKARIKLFRIVDDGVLVRDFIPVRFTNELGQSEGAMYDSVSKQLFRNQGTGAFTYGGDK